MNDYILTRSKRKTIAIYVRGGEVEVRAPLTLPKRDIDSFVASKEVWITDKLAMSREHQESRNAFALDYGSTIILRGAKHIIAVRDGAFVGFDGDVFCIPPNLTSEQIKLACVENYRQLAKAHISERVLDYAALMNAAPMEVKVNSAKSRWGSCSSKGNLNFSWRLMMADDNVIDYVVVHELAHLAEMNHSARFWAVVEGVLPDYKERRAQLRDLQLRLRGENWQ